MRAAKLTIHQTEFSFSAGHFTIFSATERETLHGHNYHVSVSFHVNIGDNGLSFDYRHYKRMIKQWCNSIDRHFLLPSKSPYLTIQEEGDYCVATFNHKKIPLLLEDVIVLPLTNITIEELAHWFLQHLLTEKETLQEHAIHGIDVDVYNGPGQSGRASWLLNEKI